MSIASSRHLGARRRVPTGTSTRTPPPRAAAACTLHWHGAANGHQNTVPAGALDRRLRAGGTSCLGTPCPHRCRAAAAAEHQPDPAPQEGRERGRERWWERGHEPEEETGGGHRHGAASQIWETGSCCADSSLAILRGRQGVQKAGLEAPGVQVPRRRGRVPEPPLQWHTGWDVSRHRVQRRHRWVEHVLLPAARLAGRVRRGRPGEVPADPAALEPARRRQPGDRQQLELPQLRPGARQEQRAVGPRLHARSRARASLWHHPVRVRVRDRDRVRVSPTPY